MSSKSKAYSLSYLVIAFVLVVLSVTDILGNALVSAGLNGEAVPLLACLILLGLGCVAAALGAYAPIVLGAGTLAGFIILSIDQIALVRYMTLAAVLFCIGLYGMVVSRNAVRMLMSIELMLNAVNINMVALAKYIDPINLHGQVFTIFILTVAAAEAAVGLAIVLAIYRNTETIDMSKFNKLKW
jgi:NAD(P)H-quinone oxidoreductase subunit 4L